MGKNIKVAWMYPDILYLHGDRGNILAIEKVASMLSLDVRIDRINLSDNSFDPMEYDMLIFPPGEIASFPALLDNMQRYKRSLTEYIRSGRVLLAVGTTIALFGKSIKRFSEDASSEAKLIKGLGLIPLSSREREYVFGDDEWGSVTINDKTLDVIGFQIQMADMDFTPAGEFSAFSNLKYGRGNIKGSCIDGVRVNNAFFTNMLGPLLVNNPWLAAELLRTAAKNAGIETAGADLHFPLEEESLELKKQFIKRKF